MKYYINFLLAFIILWGCDKADPAYEFPTTPPAELLPLGAPSNLKVATVSYNSAVVMWDGDTTASSYDVMIPEIDETITLTGTSCGISGLDTVQSYTWKVRACRGEEYTEWVNGASFTTTQYVDNRGDWVGTWYSQDWSLVISFVGYPISYEDYLPLVPDRDSLNKYFAKMEFEIDFDEDNSENVKIKIPALADFDLPTDIYSLPIIDEQFIFETNPDINIPLVTDSIAVSDFPFIDLIPGVGDILSGDIFIEEVTVNFNKVTLTFGPYVDYNQSLPVLGTVVGKVSIKTSSALINALLLAFDTELKFALSSTLYKKEENNP